MKPIAESRVLVVEDDPLFQRVLMKRLSMEGYQVVLAADGREGMKAIVTFDPDLVISDWMMPEVDGLELCQSIKTGLGEAAPYFILLTAKGEISDRLFGLQTGADDYLVKPCDPGELMARVRAGMRIVSLTQDLRRAVAQLQIAHDELASTRAQVAQLEGILPICTTCKKVRDADGRWHEVDEVLAAHTGADLSLVLCPQCQTARASVAPEAAPGA